MPEKRVIILERQSGGRFKYGLWADVPLSRQSFYANPNAKSQWLGATATENAAIAAGKVVEYVDVTAIDGTVQQVQAALQARWNDFQKEINNKNPWIRYGTFWDGTSWTLGGAT